MADEKEKSKDISALMDAVLKEGDDELAKIMKVKALGESKSSGDMFEKAMQAMLIKSLGKDDSDKNLLALIMNQTNQQQQMMMQMMQMMQQQQQNNMQMMLTLLTGKHTQELERIKQEADKGEKKWAELLNYLSTLYEKLSAIEQGKSKDTIESIVEEIQRYKVLEDKLKALVGAMQPTKVVTDEGKVNWLALIKEAIDKLEPVVDRILTLAEKKRGIVRSPPPKKKIIEEPAPPKPIIEEPPKPIKEEVVETKPAPIEEKQEIKIPEIPEPKIEVVKPPQDQLTEDKLEKELEKDLTFEKALEKALREELGEEYDKLSDAEKEEAKKIVKEEIEKKTNITIEEGEGESDIPVDIEEKKGDKSGT